MTFGDAQVAREHAVALQLTAVPAAAAPECVRLFSLTGGPRMPTRMLTRQEAGGQVRLFVADRVRPIGSSRTLRRRDATHTSEPGRPMNPMTGPSRVA